MKKGRVYEFWDKGKVDVMDFWKQKNICQGRKMVQS